jgi:hypothetical protein
MATTLHIESTVRDWYSRQIRKISNEMLAEARAGQIPWETARLHAHNARGGSMSEARKDGTAVGRKWAQFLKESNLSIAEVNEKILKNKFDGRSLGSLAEAERHRFYQIAIESAGKSNPDVNARLKIAGRIGKGVWVLTFATAAYSVYVADDQVQEFARQSAILGGGILGGIAGGALAGAAAGAATGPGVIIFVAGGAIVGGVLASLGVEFAFDELTE